MNAAQISAPGLGKTYNLKTIVPFAKKLGKKFAILDVDAKMSGDPFFASAIQDGTIQLFSSTSRKLEGSFATNLATIRSGPTVQPSGFLDLAAAIDSLKQNESDYFAAALDTFTIAQEHATAYIMHLNRKVKFEHDQWAQMKIMMEMLCTNFYDLNIPLKIINFHLKMEKNEFTGETKDFPLIEGGFREKAASYMTEFYQCYVKDVGQGKMPEYRWRVRPTARFNARSSVFGNVVDVLQDWSPVCQTLMPPGV